MLDLKLFMLLKELMSADYKTGMQISQSLKVSEKTARTRIKELNEVLKKHGADIVSKKRFGYQLHIVNQVRFQEFYANVMDKENESLSPTTSSERVPYILAYLLNRVEYIRIEDLCDFLFVSRNTLTADLKKVEYILNSYHLQLERRPNYGIMVKGSEFSRRVCLANGLIKWGGLEIGNVKKQQECSVLGGILLDITDRHKIVMTEISFESLINHLYITIERIKRNFGIVFEENIERDILGKDIIRISEEMAEEIKEQLEIVFDHNEILYLAVHLSAKIAHRGDFGSNMVIPGKIDELVLRMLNTVYEVFKFDFRRNLELRMSLNQHMVPLDIRLTFGIPLKNPILEQIKKEYALAYTLASGACMVLREHYKREIAEDEIGYFALLFALALEKQDKTIEKKNIVIVCASGKGSSQLFIYKYKQAFGQYIDHIYECTVYDLADFDFSGKHIDYVFTTIPIGREVPVPIFEVNLFLNNKDILSYRKLFLRGSNEFLHKYYKRELFLPCLASETKEEVIEKLCVHTEQLFHLPDGFYEAVMKREKLGQTDFGNLAAIPHPYKVMTEDNFVTVAVLEHPIWWGHNEVRVVFLIALSMEKDADVERFYQITTNLLFDVEKIESLISRPEFENLFGLLCDSDNP